MADMGVQSTIRDVTIESVLTRQVGKNNSTIWDVQTAGGPKLSTFRAEIGNAAKTIHENGLPADMVISISQNGDFTNYNLEKVQIAKGSASTMVAKAAEKAQEAQTVSFETFSKAEVEKRAYDAAKEDKRNESIHRQVAAKVAATLNTETTTATDFWQNVTSLVEFFQTGQVPNGFGTVTTHSEDQDLHAQGLASDSDIPF